MKRVLAMASGVKWEDFGRQLVIAGFLCLLGAGLAACQDKPVESSPAAAPTNAASPPSNSDTNVQTFLVRGVIKKINSEEKTVSIQHEEIPNFMPAMTMPFNLKDLAELKDVQPGDSVWFRLWVTADESWIDKIAKDKAASTPPPPPVPPEREAVRVARDVPVLKVGDPMPNYTLTNDLGQAVSLHDFKGQALVFTFIFTRCPIPEFCPRMSQNFAEAYKQLSAKANAPTNWHFLSISFDPHFDTPDVLRGYAMAFRTDPRHWSFVTGAMIDIDALTDHFELTIIKRGNEWDHKLRTVIVDANGRIQNIIIGNEWTPESLVEEVVKAATVEPAAQPTGG